MAHLFCELYLKLQAVGLTESYRCPLPITQIDLADALGLTPVHVNRVLQEMRGQSLITLRGQTLVIEAWDELLRIAEFDPTYLQPEHRAVG
ncbi:helix-turn-helix domain-containing protein [Methylorubrum extorquens]|uniref:helix-turn-helix domain-containing protein n=1 Tax=Methylorubrum extorquens TaxID=408 RepID=UPI000A7ACCAD|nr:helix-turn-helix domain-containing protein [Methylorubrum extorquens]UYW33462.1 helix-turn-helix domain-containing protein [Methylorubrum extorquens]